jgi:hypothetical protein
MGALLLILVIRAIIENQKMDTMFAEMMDGRIPANPVSKGTLGGSSVGGGTND